MRGVAQGNTIRPLTFAVLRKTVAKWITYKCKGYEIVEIEIKRMDYINDEVCIADSEEDIRKTVEIQSEFADCVGIKFGTHKYAY